MISRRASAGKTLERSAHDLTECPVGLSVLKAVNEADYRLLLADSVVPSVDGVELYLPE